MKLIEKGLFQSNFWLIIQFPNNKKMTFFHSFFATNSFIQKFTNTNDHIRVISVIKLIENRLNGVRVW